MKNLTLKTLNSDGSTTVFGERGNASEYIDLEGVSVFAEPLVPGGQTPVPVWYTPPMTDQYFLTILNNQGVFQGVANGVNVFMINQAPWPDEVMRWLFAYLAKNDIKLGFIGAALVAGPEQPGYGVEGFAPVAEALVSFTSLVKRLGGTLSYLGWDEPWYYGSHSTGIYTNDQLAAAVARAGADVRAIFPDIHIGDIEPVGSGVTADGLQGWFNAYARAAGKPFEFFQADVTTWTLGWQTDLGATIAMAHANGMPVGLTVDGVGAASNDAAWAAQAVATAQLIQSTPSLRPDYLVVESWETHPSDWPDPNTAGTLASVEADVAAGQAAALAVPAVARYDTAGFLGSVTWAGGWQAIRAADWLELRSPAGTVVNRISWGTVQVFAFDPNTATVSLTTLAPATLAPATLAPATGPASSGQGRSLSINAGAGGFTFDTPAVASAAIRFGLAPSSQTGLGGSGITNQAMPSLQGTAPPNSVISLQLDGAGVGTATANAAGAWNYVFTVALGDGAHAVRAGGAGLSQVAVVSVDTARPAQPTLALGAGSDTAYPGDNITTVAQPVFAGVAGPDDDISLVIDGAASATVKAGPDGQWSYGSNAALAAGRHSVAATAVNRAGTSSAAVTMQLTIDTAAQEAALTSADPLFDPAWYLENHPDIAASGLDAYTHFMTLGWKAGYDPSPFFATRYYLAQYPDVAAAGINPLTHFEQAGWRDGRNAAPGQNTIALGQSLPGIHADENPVIAYVRSLARPIAVYTAAPGPLVALLQDTGASASDRLTNDPTLAVAAKPGSTVTITLDTAAPAKFTLGSSGSWVSAYAPASLADGLHALAVTQTAPDGTGSALTLAFTLDRTPPPVTVALVADTGVSATDAITARAALAGKSDPAATVKISMDGGPAASVATDAGGTWTYAPNLPDGAHTASVTGVDAAGNSKTATLAFTLDTTPPPGPVLGRLTYVATSGSLASYALSGNAEVGATVRLTSAAATLGSVTAMGSGDWIIPVVPAATGIIRATLTATATDAAGNGSVSQSVGLLVGSSGGETGSAALSAAGSLIANTILGLGGDDALTGSNGSDWLDGGDGNDTLADGGTGGNDTMIGGSGNDSYSVTKPADAIIEAAGGGVDTVLTSLSGYSLATGANVENLTYTGPAGFNGIGNDLANTIKGGNGNDTLDGGLNTAGGDRLIGCLGNDTYIVRNPGDVVMEDPGGGTDTVAAAVASYTLASNLENLTFIGTGRFTGIGNGLNNIIVGGQGNDSLSGGAGNDTLVGGRGADTLTGGTGADIFVLARGDANGDLITDFLRTDGDKVSFTGFGAGATLGSRTYAAGVTGYVVHGSQGTDSFALTGNVVLTMSDTMFN